MNQPLKAWVSDYAAREGIGIRAVWRRLKRNPDLVRRVRVNRRVVLVMNEIDSESSGEHKVTTA